MPGENLTEKVEILPSAVDRKNSFLVRFNRIPYNKDTDPYNLNIELAETAVMCPGPYRIFDKWPSWEWEKEVLEVIREHPEILEYMLKSSDLLDRVIAKRIIQNASGGC